MANGILMSGQPMGALDANFISQARQSPLAEPEDPYRALADALRMQEGQATSEIERIKGDKLGKFFNALGAFGAGIQGQDPSRYSLQGQLAPWQEQQRQAQLGIAQTGLQRQQAEQQALQRMGGGVGNYNPRDYTADSWATFVQGGLRDPSVLVRHDPFSQGGARYIPDGKGGFVPALSEEQITDTGRIQAEIDRLRAMQKEIGTRTGEVVTATEVGDARSRISAAVKEAEAKARSRGESLTDLSRAKAAMPELEAVVGELKELAPIATYTLAGKFFDQAVKQTGFGTTEGATARAKYTAILNNQVLPLLRNTFGAAFTEKDREALQETMGDPDSSPEEKLAQLDAFIAQKYREIETKEREAGITDVQGSTRDDNDPLGIL